jgi:SsrA-binding protein
MEKKPVKLVANNKKAYHDYFIEEKYEAGLGLAGTEVKSLRMGKCSIKEAFITIVNGEAIINGMHISPYEKGNIWSRDPLRDKKLLMHKKEILKLGQYVMRDSFTLIPLSLYFSGSRVKMEVGLCRGKKLYDKRESDAKRHAEREIERASKGADKY